ncbi:MAG TPA: DNA gyrase inhibitor YacG [Vicinamibacterales bacterium]
MPDAPLCVYCRQRPVDPAWRPFCSERCRTVDLGRWLTGGYRVAGEQADAPVDVAGQDEADRVDRTKK